LNITAAVPVCSSSCYFSQAHRLRLVKIRGACGKLGIFPYDGSPSSMATSQIKGHDCPAVLYITIVQGHLHIIKKPVGNSSEFSTGHLKMSQTGIEKFRVFHRGIGLDKAIMIACAECCSEAKAR